MKKSKSATFFLSFIPGLGHFYLGLMNRGLQLMLLFFGSFYLFHFLDFIPYLIPVIWFYGIFDALELHNQGVREGEVPDQPFIPWGKSKPLGWILILAGGYFLINNFLPGLIQQETYEMIRISFVALLLIFLGIRMITGKKMFPSKSKGHIESRDHK
ncbi:hypothetical protein GXN76_02695 [Kroppenstedtia pulmonis]|uniref:TM2 domain-containing protein n=1 Tax=Kroppenstedtia pulmonis TaxID=1380685 RepID=A0A7D3XHB4_9BACL|nr:hypothetical protein [Kroppenstedtia pulmonis]QKG83484.1 hypothetical protein GXN76_02695 [Kroppenstedtia pulmonis]